MKKKEIGHITSIIFSPKYKKNMGFIIAYESDILKENNKNYYVKTEHGFIETTINDFN